MRLLALLILIAVCRVISFAQDGSDMNYVYPSEIDKTHVGRRMHIDFYRRSRGTLGGRGKGFNVDSINLEFGGKQIEFVEHRTDDGFNNWFSGQYLEATNKKIREFRLISFDKETVRVTAYMNVEPFEKEFVFKKFDIAQFMVKVGGKE